jgi:excisionase family DNA binding protein
MECKMKPNPANIEVISVKEVMRRLDCGRSTVYRMLKDGTLHSVAIRGARRVRVDSVNKVASGDAA